MDVIGGNIVVEVAPDSSDFTVQSAAGTDNYALWQSSGTPTQPSAQPSVVHYAWSVKSSVYHYTDCEFVKSISPANLARGTAPPSGNSLHEDCAK